MKRKIKGLSKKVKVPLEKSEVKDIIQGEFEFLKNKSDLEKAFFSKLKGKCLRPKVVVSYKKIPHVYGPGNVRITLRK